MKSTTLIAGALALAILGGGIWWAGGGGDSASPDMIVVPELTGQAAAGQEAFARYCASCHGENAGGTEQGSPLIHPYYEPGHHADFAFERAVRQGAPAHHWDFGAMPPVEGVTDAELAAMIDYVRTVQRANGIE